eukprot:EG_transcript_17147
MNVPGSDFVGQEVFRYLDQLAASNPEEYRAFVKGSLEGGRDFLKNSSQNSPPADNADITPRWGLRCPLSTNKEESILINVCGSQKMAKFKPGEGEVPLFMSPIVSGQVDVVVHDDVLRQADREPWFKQELIDLFTSTLTEQHAVSVIAKACRLAPARSPGLGKSPQQSQSVLGSLTNIATQTPSHPQPEQQTWIVDAKQPTTFTLMKEVSSKPLIKEVDALPSILETATHVLVDIYAECESVQDIDLTIKSNVLRLQVGSSIREINLPSVVRDVDYTAKFLKKKQLLKLRFEKLQL